MGSASKDAPVERQGPNIREHIDGVKFRQLAPGITTHPLVRSGRPCIEGTTIEVKTIAGLQNFHDMDAEQIADHLWIQLFMVQNALNYYAEHKQYIDVSIELSSLNHDQAVCGSAIWRLFPIRNSIIDENLSPEIGKILQAEGIDVIRGALGADDPEHLQRASGMRRVVCTEDDDFLVLAAAGNEHAGIIKGEQEMHSIGDWVKYLRLVHAACTTDELRNTVSFVFPID